MIRQCSVIAAQYSASAVLAKAQATRMQATATAERYEPLVRANAISQQEIDMVLLSSLEKIVNVALTGKLEV